MAVCFDGTLRHPCHIFAHTVNRCTIITTVATAITVFSTINIRIIQTTTVIFRHTLHTITIFHLTNRLTTFSPIPAASCYSSCSLLSCFGLSGESGFNSNIMPAYEKAVGPICSRQLLIVTNSFLTPVHGGCP